MGISAAVAIGAIGGAVVSSAMTKTPNIPAPAAPAKPPESQAAKTPDASEVLKGQAGTGQAGGSPGIAQTFLTGSGGVKDTDVKTTRSMLLGS